MRRHKVRCCDCGLVHILDYKVYHHGRGHKVLVKWRRDNRATGQSPKHKKLKKMLASMG